jgi:aminomethyltransferase
MADLSSLRRTPLAPFHTAARMVPFAGWTMPVQFTGISAEHRAVRDRVGLFDISHMGKFVLTGPGAIAQLQHLVPSNLARLQPGQAQYTVFLNPAGGIIDDLIVYYQGQDDTGEHLRLIVNAATTAGDRHWLEQQLDDTVTLVDESEERVLIAVQGPEAIAQVQSFTPTDLSTLGRYCHATVPLLGSEGFIARTGYTGEDGVEIMTDIPTGQALWRSLLEAGVPPCGLGARDTLRLEAAMALYGQDIDTTTTPLEAGLTWLVHLDEVGDFIGRSRLEQQRQQGVERRLVGLQLSDRNIARAGYEVYHNDTAVGQVTSGTLAPTLGYPIALAYVPPALSKPGQALTVNIRGRYCPAQVVKRPFYRRA